MGAAYDHWEGLYLLTYWYYWLSQADFDLSAGNDVYFKIDTSRSGLDIVDRNTQLMDDLYWWGMGTVAGMIPYAGLVLSPAIGLIPILEDYYAPQTQNSEGFSHVWANETFVDHHVNIPQDDRGTISFPVEIRFYERGPGWQEYTFTTKMASWIHANQIVPPQYWNDRDTYLYYTDSTTLQIKW